MKWEKCIGERTMGNVGTEIVDTAHKLAMVKADLANANAEIACLKYENDQIKKELMLVEKTMEYLQDERTSLLKIIGDK